MNRARRYGAPATSLIDLQGETRLVAFAAGAPEVPLLVATSAGRGFACRIADLLSRQRGGKQFIGVDEGYAKLDRMLADGAI